MRTKFFTIAVSLLYINALSAQSFNSIDSVKVIAKIIWADMVDNSFAISNDKKRIGYRIRNGNKQQVVIDGTKGDLYDSVTSPVFSADSKHVVFALKRMNVWKLNINGKEEPIASQKGEVAFHMFSPSNNKLVYIMKENGKAAIIINGKRSAFFDAINENSIAFNSDGDIVAYTIEKGSKQANVYNGKVGEYFDLVGFPLLSFSGKRLAYWATNSGKSFVVIDNKRSNEFDQVNSIKFSADEKHCAYTFKDEGMYYVVSDGIKSEKYNFVHSLAYSPSGSRLVYAVESLDENDQKFNHAIVLDGIRQKIYETVVEGSLLFSSDSKHFAYEAEWHDEFFIVNDGVEGKRYNDVMQITLTYSSNGNRLAYAIENDSKRKVSVDGETAAEYDDVTFIAFSQDNQHVLFSAKEGVNDFIVIDGQRRKSYSSILGQGGFAFDSPTSFHYLIISDDTIQLVFEKI